MDTITTRYWSRSPGKFVNQKTGDEANFIIDGKKVGPIFTGDTNEWCETLVETIIDVRNQLHRSAIVEIGPCRSDQVNVFASSNVLSTLQVSVLWKPHFVMELDPELATHQVATLAMCNVWYDRATAENAARVVAMFKADDGRQATLHGCVKVLDA